MRDYMKYSNKQIRLTFWYEKIRENQDYCVPAEEIIATQMMGPGHGQATTV